jgi:microcystin-dependent protein
MPGFVIPSPKFRAFTAAGVPLAAGKLFSYAGGTSTPLATYSDEALLVPNANPVVLDANGEATIFIPDDTAYKFVLQNSASVQQWSVDNVKVPSTEAAPAAVVVPAGALLMYGGASAPTGYLICDGSAISRTTFAALFTAIGTTWGGGDGSTTFNIPDLRQRFPLGKAAAGTGAVLAEVGGTIDHVHTGPSHTHGVTVTRDGWGSQTNITSVAGRVQTGDGAGANFVQATADVTVTSAAGGTGNTGTANPPYAAVNFIIRTGN